MSGESTCYPSGRPRPPKAPPPPSRIRWEDERRRAMAIDRVMATAFIVCVAVAFSGAIVTALKPQRVCLEVAETKVWLEASGELRPHVRRSCLRWEAQP